MTAPHIVDPHGLLSESLAEASPDLMRQLLQMLINELLSADAEPAKPHVVWGAVTRLTKQQGEPTAADVQQ